MSATAEASGDQEEFTIGRGGLKVPTIEWHRNWTTLSNASSFFEDLWRLNDGFEEKVLLAEDDKPLLIVRELQTPRTVRVKEIGATMISGYDKSTHLLTLPDQSGDPPASLASFWQDHDQPRLSYRGERIEEDHSWSSDFSESRAQSYDDMKRNFDIEVRRVIGEIAGMLS